jgi:type VI secretion system protein ImpE
MSTAEELFREGNLRASLAELQQEVRRKPAEGKLRTFLAQLLMLTGDWDRALNQLNVAGELDASTLLMKQTYGAAIQCERLRSAVFAGEKSPLIFGDPQPWIAALIQGLALQSEGHATQAAELRAGALEAAPTTAGTLNGTPFEWIADADSRLGPVLEVLLNGAYYWIPFSRIRHVKFEAAADGRDLVWIPAQFTWSNSGEAMGLVPVRYPGSEHCDEDTLRMSRRTEWRELGGQEFAGLGQRVLTTNADEIALLEVREISLEVNG